MSCSGNTNIAARVTDGNDGELRRAIHSRQSTLERKIECCFRSVNVPEKGHSLYLEEVSRLLSVARVPEVR